MLCQSTSRTLMMLWVEKEIHQKSKNLETPSPWVSPSPQSYIDWFCDWTILGKKLSVVANFTCQVDWPSCAQIKHCFWVFLWECFWVRLVFELVDWLKQMALPSIGGHHPNRWGSEKNLRWRKEKFAPFFSSSLLSWDI